MVLQGTYKVKSVLHKTTAKMFSGVKEGDNIKFSLDIMEAGRHSGEYATYVKCVNLRTMEVVYKSVRQLRTLFYCFEFEE